MIDNYFGDYHSWDQVYTHPDTHHHLYIGDLSSAQNLNFLHSQTIRTVITAALGMDHLDYSDLAVKHIVYPLLDHRKENISQFFEEFYNLVEKELREGNILVHCSAGISRSATLIISYLMRRESMSFREAIEYVRKHRPKVLPNLGFERQLKSYQNTLTEKQPTRKNICLTSCNKRTVKTTQQSELSQFRLRPNNSTPLVLESPDTTSLQKKKETFKIRALKLRSLDCRQRAVQKPKSAWDVPEAIHLNFQVFRVQLGCRLKSKKRMKSRLEEE